MIDEKFVIIAVLLNLLGGLSYMTAVLKGQVKPNKVTWLFWGIAPMVIFSAQITEGVGWPALMTFVFGASPFLIFLLSFLNKKAYWKITKFDIFCGAVSLLGIFLWWITRNAQSAILFSILADLSAGVPTLIKAFKFPETEDSLAYFFPVLGALVTLLTLNNWSFTYSGFPLYVLIICLIFTVLIKYKLGKVILSRLNQFS